MCARGFMLAASMWCHLRCFLRVFFTYLLRGIKIQYMPNSGLNRSRYHTHSCEGERLTHYTGCVVQMNYYFLLLISIFYNASVPVLHLVPWAQNVPHFKPGHGIILLYDFKSSTQTIVMLKKVFPTPTPCPQCASRYPWATYLTCNCSLMINICKSL